MTASVNTNEHDARYIIGIDLGTTNTAVTYVDLDEAPGLSGRRLHTFEIPQLVEAGELGHRPVLPSFLYLPGSHELPEGSTALPWAPDRTYAVGAFAQEQGARVPGRLVASAKSWLCNPKVDRTAPILPWGAPDEVDQVSPVEAATRYLTHLREAWNDAHPEAPLETQAIVLTVPASFDEVARELTVDAAKRAGLPNIVLLEEPLAAFYAWLDTHDDQRDQLQDGELILVCDVGGGTTDFSIIGIQRDEDDNLQFDRLAVGDHLMLGGDNMDHALGRTMEAELTGDTGNLDVQRWHQLVHQCRRAKEQLLRADDSPDEVAVTVAGQGGRLIADTLSGQLDRAEVQDLVVDGFFPETSLDAPLQQDRRSGLTELGLPYEQDPAITRQLAAFWRRTQPYLQEKTGRTHPRPDYLLFNGGVFNSAPLRERTKHVVSRWFAPDEDATWTPKELRNDRLDLAVATGAAYYGLVRRGEGTRVGSGSPRAYYVGLETGDNEDGDGQPAICLVPRGAPEGFEGHLRDMEFEARANQPVTFHLFSSTTRSGDAPGDVVQLQDADEVTALPPIRTVLEFGKRYARAVPVQLGVRLTEVGTLQLWCESVYTEHRWTLQFDVRQDPDTEALATEDMIDAEQVETALAAIRDTFEGKKNTNAPDALWTQLESIFDAPREHWPLPLLRKCADTLLDTPRDHSLHHEVCWYNLLGYCLRPGYGDAVDDWRMQQAWILKIKGLEFARREDNRMAWWLFWRRVAGGLPGNKQEQFYYEARPFIQLDVRTRKDHPVYNRRMKMREKSEAWQTLATFERAKPAIKIELAELLLEKFTQSDPYPEELWALSRLGTRHPAYGPLDKLVPPEEVAAWLKVLLEMDLERSESAAYALVHLARRSGDRDLDVPQALRERVSDWLGQMPNPEPYRALLQSTEAAPDHPGQDWFIVEPLPTDAAAVLDPQGITVATSEEAAANPE